MENTLDFMKARRSTRKFNVPQEDMEAIVEAGRYAKSLGIPIRRPACRSTPPKERTGNRVTYVG